MVLKWILPLPRAGIRRCQAIKLLSNKQGDVLIINKNIPCFTLLFEIKCLAPQLLCSRLIGGCAGHGSGLR